MLTSVHLELLLVHVDDVGTDSVHEVLGVRDEQQDAVELLQRVFQPHAGLQVQVIGGLVQDEEGRVDE